MSSEEILLEILNFIAAFIFMDANSSEDEDLPAELRDKYTLSRLLGRWEYMYWDTTVRVFIMYMYGLMSAQYGFHRHTSMSIVTGFGHVRQCC